jgi:hypothetical protein
MKTTISISQDFNNAPAGRFKSDGEFSGETFRNKFLIPKINDKNVSKIIINLDNLDGVGSSFWEEAFGGLIRVGGLPLNTITEKIDFICNDDTTIIPLIKKFLNKANEESK